MKKVVKKYEDGSIVCIGCGNVTNKSGEVIDRVTGVWAAEQHGAKRGICTLCGYRMIASGFDKKKGDK